jgi:RNA polymerase sigma factor (sigma-70 family)
MRFTTPDLAHRRRIIEICYPAVLAAAHKLRNVYRTSFTDIDLTAEDLGQYGALKAIEYYDRLMADAPGGVLVLTDEALKKSVITLAMRCIACRIIDVYRKRDHQHATNLADVLIDEMDDSEARRVDLWRRVEALMPRITPRQRSVVVGLWQGLNVVEIGATIKMSTNAVHKDIAAVRRIAA